MQAGGLEFRILKVESAVTVRGVSDYVLGYAMEEIQNSFFLGCPVYERNEQLIAIETVLMREQVTFLHHCRDETCVYEESRLCSVKKEGKVVNVTKPAFTCDTSANRQYVLNAYSFYNKCMPDIDKIP